MLAATGAAALSASWVRVFVNGEPLGLFVLTDDASTHMVDNLLHGGDWSYPYSGTCSKTHNSPPLLTFCFFLSLVIQRQQH